MVNLNTLPKICILVAFGLSATATSTDVAQEQPKKESFLCTLSSKEDVPDTKPVEVQEKEITETQGKTEASEPVKFSVEWFLLPKPKNRACLRARLPWELQYVVPRNCNKPIEPWVEEKIREFLSLSDKEQCFKRAFTWYCSN